MAGDSTTLGYSVFDPIRQYLEHEGITQRQLARILGISTSHMHMLNSGQRRPSPELAQRIEAVTGVPFRRLLLPDDAEPVIRGARQ